MSNLNIRLSRDSLVNTFTSASNLLSFAPFLDGHETLLSAGVEDFLDALGNVQKVRLGGELYVLLHVTRGREQLKEVAINAEAVVLNLGDDGAGDHISGTESLFVLPVGEDVLTSDHGFGGTVLAGLGSRKGGDSARKFSLEHNKGAWLHATSFSKLSDGRTGIALFELVVRHY